MGDMSGPCAPEGPTKSATVMRLEGSAFSKITPSLMSSSSAFFPGKAGGKLVSCVTPRGLTAASMIFSLSIRAAWRTAQPLTVRLVEVSGVMVKKPASSWCLKRTSSTR